jgi:hypothetical protein
LFERGVRRRKGKKGLRSEDFVKLADAQAQTRRNLGDWVEMPGGVTSGWQRSEFVMSSTSFNSYKD